VSHTPPHGLGMAVISQNRQGLSPRVLLCFIIVTLIWGSTWIVIKDQLGVVPASWSVTYRFLVAGLVMMGVAVATGERLALPRSAIPFVLAFGVAQFVFNFNFVYRAEHYVTSGLVAVVFALLFVPNAILSRLFLGHSVSRRFMTGSGIAIAGIGLLFVQEARGDAGSQLATLTGIGFTMAGVMSASIANVMQATERARSLSVTVMLCWGMLAGAVLDGAFAWVTSGQPVVDLRWGYALGIGYLGIMASAVAFSLYFYTIRELGAAKAAYSSVLIPVIAMAFSTVFEGYHWSALSIGGAGLTMVGMVVAMSGRR
jgi:drug/metabolite transporter (DMT)-like permease